MKFNEVSTPILESSMQDDEKEYAKNLFMTNIKNKLTSGLDQEINTGTVIATPVQAQAQAQSNVPKTPDQIRKEKLAVNGPAANASMTPKPIQAAVAPASKDYDQIRKDAALKARASMIQKEGTFNKLNYILESIININEDSTLSISQYIQKMFIQSVKSPIFVTDTRLAQSLKKYADRVQETYPIDKGQVAIGQLVNWGYDQLSNRARNAGPATGSNMAYNQVKSLLDKLSDRDKSKLLARLSRQ